MRCAVCSGIGFVWGRLLRDPWLVRCACSGGPPRWLDDGLALKRDRLPSADIEIQTHGVRGTLRGGAGGLS